jgi:pyruvate dehydrogenase E2 component (dihydrolipoamide acetyltransferase)
VTGRKQQPAASSNRPQAATGRKQQPAASSNRDVIEKQAGSKREDKQYVSHESSKGTGMATAVVMPKQGNSVESCIIVNWKKHVGDTVVVDDVLCEVETDKATMDVPSPVAGTLLATFFKEGDDVPVMTAIAAVGAPGEDVSPLAPAGATASVPPAVAAVPAQAQPAPAADAVPAQLQSAPAADRSGSPSPAAAVTAPAAAPGTGGQAGGESIGVSPRARHLAARKGIDPALLGGSGPGGRVIERDVQAAMAAQPKLTPVAKAMVADGGYSAPAQGSGPGGRVMSKDLLKEDAQTPAAMTPAAAPAGSSPAHQFTSSPVQAEEAEIVAVKGVRKVIADRMLQSLQTTAQLTLHASADARALQALRARLKGSPEALGLRGVTINDLVLLAVARTLPQFPGVNALFTGDAIHQHKRVQLGVAVDTPRGLMVPVVRNADSLSLRGISGEAKRLANACINGKVLPDELNGGTFTVTNLGAFGVEMFTPVLNPPQVAILGVCNIQPKPVEVDGNVEFIPHIGLSLTINHQVVDGAPAARFLQALGQAIAAVDLLLAG